jgi:hypothetical protein
MEKLFVKNIINSNIAVATDAGDKVFNQLIASFETGKKTSLDFEGITIMTTAFLNAAIGQLYSQGKYDSNFLNNSLKLVNIQPEDIPLFVMVVNRAKEYFANKEKFEGHSEEVFGSN